MHAYRSHDGAFRLRHRLERTLLAGLLNWVSLSKALVVREIRTRFSGGSLGYAWAVIIPVAWILAITVFFYWIGRSAPIAVDLPIFVATGMIPYLVFRQVVTSMMRACRAQRHLITLGPAKPDDIFAASGLLEMINAGLVTAAILLVITSFSVVPMVQDPLTVLFGLALAWGLGMSAGRLAAVMAAASDTAQRLVPILLRPFFWISGIFFVAAELPGELHDFLWFNPLLHVIEILRLGWFGNFPSEAADFRVPLIATAALYFASRALEHSPLVGTAALSRP